MTGPWETSVRRNLSGRIAGDKSIHFLHLVQFDIVSHVREVTELLPFLGTYVRTMRVEGCRPFFFARNDRGTLRCRNLSLA
jgi:hypothetical protein